MNLLQQQRAHYYFLNSNNTHQWKITEKIIPTGLNLTTDRDSTTYFNIFSYSQVTEKIDAALREDRLY